MNFTKEVTSKDWIIINLNIRVIVLKISNFYKN